MSAAVTPARLVVAVLCLGLVIAGWAASRAPAVVPGVNGKIAFVSARDGNFEVYTMNADGTGQVNRTNNAADDQLPTWSPDGTKIAFISGAAPGTEIYTMNADGTGQVRLTNNAANDQGPAWSPDGTKIAFSTDRDGNSEVYTMNADGTGQVNRTNNAALIDSSPDWSPDGTKIAFTTNRDGPGTEIYTMNADGTGLVRLTNNAATDHPASDGEPAWSPDGTKIAFRTTRDGNSEVYVMNADGSGQVRLTNNAAIDQGPAWSPDGTKIAFATSRDGNVFQIYTMNADGSGQVRLTPNAADNFMPDWGTNQDNECPDVQVGFAVAQGCFTETEPGSGMSETAAKAWVGGFEIVPRAGGSLILDTKGRSLSTGGTGADVVFAGFKVPIPVRALPVDAAEAKVGFGGGAGTVAKVLDVPVEASVKVEWTEGGRSATYEQKVAIKELTKSIGPLVTPPGTVLGDFGGELKAKLENGVGFVLERGEVRLDKVTLVPDKLDVKRELEVKHEPGLRDLLLRFERRDNKPFWTGRAGITLPVGRRDLGFTGTVFVFDGALAGGGLAIDGIDKQLGGTPLFLQGISGDLLFAPRWGHNLGITGSLGPRVQGKQLLTLAGQMSGGELIVKGSDCPSGDDPEKLVLSSKLTPLAPLELAGLASATMSMRACSYPFAGLVPAIDVTASVEIEFAGGALAYEASQTGFVSDRGASLEGPAKLTVPIPGLSANSVGDSSVLSGAAIVSTEGTGACASLGFVDAGFGYRWGEGVPSVFTGCNLGRFRVTASASVVDAHAAQAEAIEVPKGLPHAGFAAAAQGGPPRVTVSGPGGFELSSPPDGSVLRTPEALIAPVATESTTYVFVRKPRAGAWRVEAADPNQPLSNVSFARGLPDPKVKGRVRKPGRKSKRRKFRFRYEVRRIAGQRITFTERGAGIARRLGSARGDGGAISFKPTIATARRRKIEAEVIQDGLPRELVTVARFKAPRPPRLKAPKVEAKRKRASLRLSWARVRGAASYIAEVKAGREVLFRVLTRKRKLRFAPTPRKGKLKVSVRALSNTRPPGPAAKLKLKARR